MRQTLLTFFLSIMLCATITSNASAQKPSKPALPARPEKACVPTASKPCTDLPAKDDKYKLNILELTNSQMYRYGREMFLAGNNAESAKVFLEIIRLDCHNRSAHYHLQKIAERDPAYAFLTKTLRNLPCGSYDFTREDFLPASVYYEKDTDILLEQLLVYHKRQRMTEDELKKQAEKYNALVDELQITVAALTRLPGMDASDADMIERVITGRKIANKIDKEIAYLKSQLTSQRLDDQKEIQDLRTRLAAGEAELANAEEKASSLKTAAAKTTDTPTPAAIEGTAEEKPYSSNAQALINAVEKAKTDLQYKERLLADKDKELSSLQARFDDILRRLKVIQEDLAKKNDQIKAIQLNLQSTPKS
jgi:hypothetical protein